MANYLQHGRRHGTGGSDPILGLAASLDWCYANGNIDTDGTHPSLSTFYTSDANVFALNGGSDGIDINSAGVYLAFIDADIEDGAAAITKVFTLTTIWGGSIPPPTDRIKGPVSQPGADYGGTRRWEPSSIELLMTLSSATLTYTVDCNPATTLTSQYTTV